MQHAALESARPALHCSELRCNQCAHHGVWVVDKDVVVLPADGLLDKRLVDARAVELRGAGRSRRVARSGRRALMCCCCRRCARAVTDWGGQQRTSTKSSPSTKPGGSGSAASSSSPSAPAAAAAAPAAVGELRPLLLVVRLPSSPSAPAAAGGGCCCAGSRLTMMCRGTGMLWSVSVLYTRRRSSSTSCRASGSSSMLSQCAAGAAAAMQQRASSARPAQPPACLHADVVDEKGPPQRHVRLGLGQGEAVRVPRQQHVAAAQRTHWQAAAAAAHARGAVSAALLPLRGVATMRAGMRPLLHCCGATHSGHASTGASRMTCAQARARSQGMRIGCWRMHAGAGLPA